MMRLVRTYRPFGQPNPLAKIWPHTYYPLAFAALIVLLPNFVKGQCYELICNQNVPLKLGNDCTGSVNPYFMISNNWSCQGPMDMEYYDAWGTPIGEIVDESYLGQTLEVHVTHNWTGLTCWGTVEVVDVKKPIIDFDHVTLNCSEDPSVTSVGEPMATDNCSGSVTLSHQDSVIDFGCGYTGFAGYFDPSNWEICLPNTGDGGVDVTGAPGQVLVEGADSSPQASSPLQVTRFKIEIPTEGFVSFDWSSTGGPNFGNEGFYLTINNWCIQITNDSVQGGSYTTGLLQPGDILSFEQMSNGDAASVNTVLSNFHFHTAAWKVIHRTWAATDASGNTRYETQVVTLNRATLSQVQFPPDRDGISAPMLDCGGAANLSETGLPFVDEDGDLTTTDDQFDLQSGDCMLSYLFEDQVIMTCEGSELIIRKWTVVDDCSSQILEHTQLIKLFDVTAPTVVCPPGQVISTDDFGCFSTLTLPQATATDDCSSTIDITPHWNYGTGFGPFDDVAIGTYVVTYEATDACGNTGACTTTVLVEDAIEPTVVCDGQTIASLDSDGQAIVFADAVDDGSYDWCCIANYEIKLESAPVTEYAPTLPVSCDDLGAPLMVTLKVTDCYGNFNTCNVDLIVKDNYDPVILPPADVTVDCSTDLSDLSIFGDASAFDNCEMTLAEEVDESATGCGEATLTRTWTATDPSGNSVTASQTITLANLTPWNETGDLIAWPPDYQTNECNPALEPWDLPLPYSGPILGGQTGCESVAVSHEDEIFWVAEPACFKIFRTWKIIDWCQFSTNTPGSPGIWEHTQVIEVIDEVAPVFIDPPSQVFAQGNADCTGNVILPLPELDDCSEHMAITASGDLGTGFSFADVPSGTYSMTYTAEDGCGNFASHTFTVSVGDDTPPSAVCVPGVTVALGIDGEIDVMASTFDSGSYDDCSSNFLFCYSPNPDDEISTFTCDDTGQNNVTLFVIDEGGNMSTCQTFLVVLENPDICDPLQPDVNISGLIQTPDGQEVGEAMVSLFGTPSAPVMTSTGGDFSFGNLPSGNDYEITPEKNTNFLNGVTAFDLVKINDHILGIEPFTTAWQIIAADANGSESITTADLVAVQQLILHVTSEFPNGTPSWTFVSADHLFPNWQEPWGYPSSMLMPGLTNDYLDAHFTAVKVGDVTGNANPLALAGNPKSLVHNQILDERSGGDFILRVAENYFEAGDELEIKVRGEEMAAWQGTFEFNAEVLEFQGIRKAEDTGNKLAFGKNSAADGTLTAVHHGNMATEFMLRFRARKSGQLSQTLHMSDTRTPAAAFNSEGQAMAMKLVFEKGESTALSASVFPNPFSSQATLQFNLPETGETNIFLFDATGRLLQKVAAPFPKGENTVVLRKEELNTEGLILYQIESGGEWVFGKIMVE